MAGPLESWVIHLGSEGTFRTLFATHFTAEEGLRGTWRPAGADRATLRCDRWSRMIVSGPLRVRFGRPWEEQRPKIRKGLEAFLRAHPAATFSSAEIEEVAAWEEVRGSESVTVIPLSSLTDRVSREELEQVVPLLESYATTDDPREVHVRFGTHRGVEYLEWVDWGGYTEPSTSREIHARIDAAAPGGTVPDVWVRVPPAEGEGRDSGREGLHYYQAPRRDK
jgi:hypothetical protein